ncbi:hypothetical protein GCM10009551_028610 [Nocardiopsis tropica]
MTGSAAAPDGGGAVPPREDAGRDGPGPGAGAAGRCRQSEPKAESKDDSGGS